ncbi:mRNA interferase HigB [compost metagenome]
MVKASAPEDFSELKRLFPATDKVVPQHVFDIGGNRLRLIAIVQYRAQKLFIQHVLDHAEYGKGSSRPGFRPGL